MDNDNVVSLIEDETTEFVTVHIGEQLFGLPINRVHDVFLPESITLVPLAPRDVAGVLNLRGRIVTAIDMRGRLGMPPRDAEETPMAVGIEYGGESFGLLIDSVGEVLRLSTAELESNPINLDSRWARVSAGVYRLEGRLMVILNVDRVLSMEAAAFAA
ncbi:MAG: chemotaxis protein CheW [Hyphomicrobiales bacterium]|nr:chemotaxis protein CheW [Hyphomicrobiales bacterium]